MNKPIISIIGPAHRTHFWKEFYRSVSFNEVPIEIIFVTDKKPDFTLPSNFKWIYSTVKPVQCVEIALREAQGDIIHWTADDTIYNSGCFDNAYKTYQEFGFNNMVYFKCFEETRGKWLDKTNGHFLFENVPTIAKVSRSLRMMPYGLMGRQLIKDVGGIDSQFIAGQWENDLVLRAYSQGSTMVFCEGAEAYGDHNNKHLDINGNLENNLYDTHLTECNILQDLWVTNGELVLNRQRPVEKFVDKDLLTISQGNKGKWK